MSARDAALGQAMRAVVAAEPLVALDYAVAVDADSLEEVVAVGDAGVAAPADRRPAGPVRLIDNSAALDAADEVRPVPGANGRARQLERIG